MKTPEELRELADRWGAIDQAEREQQWAALDAEQREELKAALEGAGSQPMEASTGEKKRKGCLWAVGLALGAVVIIVLLLAIIVLLLPDVPETTPAPPMSEEELAVGTPASQLIVDRINAFMEDGLSVEMVYTAPSQRLVEQLRQRLVRAYFVAGRVQGRGPQDVGVWIILGTSDEDDVLLRPGITMSVNSVAKTVSVAPDASTTASEVTMLDPPARDLYRYVESQVR